MPASLGRIAGILHEHPVALENTECPVALLETQRQHRALTRLRAHLALLEIAEITDEAERDSLEPAIDRRLLFSATCRRYNGFYTWKQRRNIYFRLGNNTKTRANL